MNPVSGLWLSRSRSQQILRNLLLYSICRQPCLLTYSEFHKRSAPFPQRSTLSNTARTHTHTYMTMHTQRLLFDSTGWTGHHLQGCDGMHTSMKLWCKTRTVWNANHGEKGERKEKRSFFTAESLYIMLFFCFCLCSCGGDSAYSNDGKHWQFSALKQIIATNITQCLLLLPLHHLSSLYK